MRLGALAAVYLDYKAKQSSVLYPGG